MTISDASTAELAEGAHERGERRSASMDEAGPELEIHIV
jgi:hypothetical protein